MPMPAGLQTTAGALRIDATFSVALTGHTEPRLDRAIQRFTAQVSRQTAIPFTAKSSASPTLTVHTDHASKEIQELGEDESYTLTVTPDADASTYWTVVHTLTVLGDASAAREWSVRAHERFPNDSRFR